MTGPSEEVREVAVGVETGGADRGAADTAGPADVADPAEAVGPLEAGAARSWSSSGRWDSRASSGTCVVHTPSPWAMVASRWTWESSSRDNAAVSAPQSSGNCSATCWTGQWCWQIWTPVGSCEALAV